MASSLVVNFIWAWGATYLIFLAVKRLITFRVPAEVEIEGLDSGEFGQVCYPDYVLAVETDTGLTHELDAPTTSDPTRSMT